jgi:hypothetical protein
MATETTSELHAKLHEAIGAVDILFLLREEIEQWQEEAQDDSKREALDNVLGHLQAMETEYERRRHELQEQVSLASST